MNQPAPIDNIPARIDSLLVPMADGELLVPMALVAEVIKLQPGEITVSPAKPWHYGWIQWREQRLPLISFESLGGGTLPIRLGEQAAITIFNAISARLPVDFYAMVTQGFPHSVRIEGDSPLEVLEDELPPGQQLKLVVENSIAIIPDLDWIEDRLAELF